MSNFIVKLLNYFIAKPVLAYSPNPSLGPEPAQIGHFNTVFSTILNLATGLGLLVVFIMLLLGGFGFLTAGGDPKAVEGAKKTITYAILGLAMMIMAWFILQLIQAITGVHVSTFNILFP